MIRVADSGDVDALAELHVATVVIAYADIFPADSAPPTVAGLAPSYETALRDADTDVFVHDDGAIVGSIVLTPDDRVPAGMRIERFNVHPTRQGAGIGRTLYRRCLDRARERGLTELNLWVLEDNRMARRIYERWGWRVVPGHTLPNTAPEVLDVLYELRL